MLAAPPIDGVKLNSGDILCFGGEALKLTFPRRCHHFAVACNHTLQRSMKAVDEEK